MRAECHSLEKGPLADQNPPIHIFLAMQGGGALGPFQVGILDHLHNRLRVGGQIKALSGVSIGGINAAIYVANYRKDPIRALKRFWNNAAYIDSPFFPRTTWLTKDTPWEFFFPYDLSAPATLLAWLYSPGFHSTRWDFWRPNWTYFWNVEPLRENLKQL